MPKSRTALQKRKAFTDLHTAPQHKAPPYMQILTRWVLTHTYDDKLRLTVKTTLPGQENPDKKKWRYTYDVGTLCWAITFACNEHDRRMRGFRAACAVNQRLRLAYHSEQVRLQEHWHNANLKDCHGLKYEDAKDVLLKLARSLDRIGAIRDSLRVNEQWSSIW